MNGGRIEVVCGPMFAGKTEELLRRVRRAALAGRRVQVFNHALDTRADGLVFSHAGLGYPSVTARTPDEIERSIAEGVALVAIDEAQFFGSGLVGTVERLASRGIVVLVAGLDVTFEGEPFEPIPSLMALAEDVAKLTAVCAVCGEDAVYHIRIDASATEATRPVAEHVGSLEKYQARCRRHFPKGGARRLTSP